MVDTRGLGRGLPFLGLDVDHRNADGFDHFFDQEVLELGLVCELLDLLVRIVRGTGILSTGGHGGEQGHAKQRCEGDQPARPSECP